MTTRSVDPAGQHQLPVETSRPGGRKNTAFWNGSFPYFDVASEHNTLSDGNPRRMSSSAYWRITAGSDLQLQCEMVRRGVDYGDDYVVRAYDSDGDDLNVLGQFLCPGDALAALPTLLTVAHMLYPNYLLMPQDARDYEQDRGRSQR